MTAPEHEAIQAVELLSAKPPDPEGTFEAAYFQLLGDLLHILNEVPSHMLREELHGAVAFNQIRKPSPPACDCGHEFSSDPHEYHLDTCAWRKWKTMP